MHGHIAADPRGRRLSEVRGGLVLFAKMRRLLYRMYGKGGNTMPWAENNRILVTLGGSHAYGLSTPESDEDYRGVALPPVSWLVGFPPRDYASQTAETKGGATDTVIHTLAKFCGLALKGNPNMLEVLFCRDAEVTLRTEAGDMLRRSRDAFLSRHTYASMSGYSFGQLKQMRSHTTNHGAHREQIERYGYSTKNAMHLIRLLLMARELLRDGECNVYREQDRDFLLRIRAGSMTANEVQTLAEDLDRECLSLRDHSPLPEDPDRARIESILMEVQTRWIHGDTTLLMPCGISGVR